MPYERLLRRGTIARQEERPQRQDRNSRVQSARADREIMISRIISAHEKLVFDAFTEVRHLSRWWGSDRFTTTRAFEFRVGGEWGFGAHSLTVRRYAHMDPERSELR